MTPPPLMSPPVALIEPPSTCTALPMEVLPVGSLRGLDWRGIELWDPQVTLRLPSLKSGSWRLASGWRSGAMPSRVKVWVTSSRPKGPFLYVVW